MKRKIALIILSLVLVLGLMPATVAAAKPSSGPVAYGVITSIDPTELGSVVNGAGNSGRWRVDGRTVYGTFLGPIIGDGFTFSYKANVNELQAGTLHGTMTTSQYTFNVNGKTGPATFFGWYGPYPLFQIDISGKWTVLDGAKGNGDFTSTIVVLTDGTHILAIIPTLDGVNFLSTITLTGSFEP